jgi:hypothetical protein
VVSDNVRVAIAVKYTHTSEQSMQRKKRAYKQQRMKHDWLLIDLMLQHVGIRVRRGLECMASDSLASGFALTELGSVTCMVPVVPRTAQHVMKIFNK